MSQVYFVAGVRCRPEGVIPEDNPIPVPCYDQPSMQSVPEAVPAPTLPSKVKSDPKDPILVPLKIQQRVVCSRCALYACLYYDATEGNDANEEGLVV